MENSHHGNTAAPWGFATFVNISMRSMERKAGDRREQTQQIPTVDLGHQRAAVLHGQHKPAGCWHRGPTIQSGVEDGTVSQPRVRCVKCCANNSLIIGSKLHSIPISRRLRESLDNLQETSKPLPSATAQQNMCTASFPSTPD